MSNPNSRCREAHGGTWARPKDQWKGRRRGHSRYSIARPQFSAAQFSSMASKVLGRNFGQLKFRRKAGNSS